VVRRTKHVNIAEAKSNQRDVLVGVSHSHDTSGLAIPPRRLVPHIVREYRLVLISGHERHRGADVGLRDVFKLHNTITIIHFVHSISPQCWPTLSATQSAASRVPSAPTTSCVILF